MSFCGADMGRYEYLHFNYEMFKEIATSFCHTMLDLADPENAKIKLVMDEIEQNFLKLPGLDKRDDGNKNQEYFLILILLKLLVIKTLITQMTKMLKGTLFQIQM
jgi:hypothetical protein